MEKLGMQHCICGHLDMQNDQNNFFYQWLQCLIIVLAHVEEHLIIGQGKGKGTT